MKFSLKNVLIGLDQTANTCVKLSDGWGTPDEMLSARAWRLREVHPKLYVWIDRLFFWDKDHCKECYEIEMTRKQLPPEYSNA
jgi:predicted Rossmann-fold nucleotide-binding protein